MNGNTTFEILNVGTELLLGDVINTDAAYLSERLAELGFPVYRHTVVGDNPHRLREALGEAYTRADAVILTGGLGPTCDDITKEMAAEYFGLPLEMNAEALATLEETFRSRGWSMTDNNRKQAMLPRGARLLKNDWGTAPGVFYEQPGTGRAFFLLPGPPGELKPLFEARVLPLLQSAAGVTIRSLNLHLRGIGESAAEALLQPLMEASENPTVAPYVGNGDVRIRITARGTDEAACERMNRETARLIRETPVGEHIYFETHSSEEARLMPQLGAVRLLEARGLRAATAESCTAGLVAAALADISGASAVLLGGAVTYASELKQRLLGVPAETLGTCGVVSEATAAAMAEGVRRLTGAEIGVSTTGVAGPGGGSAETPVGTVCFGVSTPAGTVTSRRNFNPQLSRDEIRRRATAEALLQLLEAVRRLP